MSKPIQKVVGVHVDVVLEEYGDNWVVKQVVKPGKMEVDDILTDVEVARLAHSWMDRDPWCPDEEVGVIPWEYPPDDVDIYENV